MELEKKDWERLKLASEQALREIALQQELHNIAYNLARERLKFWETPTTKKAEGKNTK